MSSLKEVILLYFLFYTTVWFKQTLKPLCCVKKDDQEAFIIFMHRFLLFDQAQNMAVQAAHTQHTPKEQQVRNPLLTLLIRDMGSQSQKSMQMGQSI